MMFLETKLVYPVPKLAWGDWEPKSLSYEDVQFTSADGTKLHGWYFSPPSPTQALLYCHGNGEDVAAVGPFAAELSTALNAAVFVFDYRGYGRSQGHPNEAGCIADGSAAQHWLAAKMKIDKSRVVLMGRSLGSGVAVALAAENGARALILENSFTSLPDVAALHYPWLPVGWIMKNRYDNLSRIKQYNGFVLQSHGKGDTLIPIEMGRALFDAAPGASKSWQEFKGGHNDPPPAFYYDLLPNYLQSIP
jgi:fermentation-respiration switch protein FrsA (DUF1100 family)